ncbi:hypothetical protein ATO12_24685 [Aquimarina atlantica]|uniref:Uncharacterized protein n=1 Tax=Aquimarina atlantica TaxID=1317122 RepID=A0A023BQ00_9FLAO|nr:hypothetical protein [Aquimarina atlantica]EZH72137.1 hypothetical protein ATO12_24685 [Aquimarina atlantica]
MKLKEYKRFKNRNSLLFGFLISNKEAIVNVNKNIEPPIERRYADEVKKYRTARFNCQKTGTLLSKLKINL